MIEQVDLSLVNWSRAQFALTAMYHWIFVPLTLGLSFMIAMMETIYVRTGKEEWKRMTKFWMKLFGINFAIGIATGIILEFEFGTNWSNYSWFVGDIFGAPLAIEGIMAFFLESTFIAVMFFGWNKVSKRFHLVSTWLVAFGASLSALWILVANGWMQYPAGMHFNPDTARNEMLSFWDVFLSPLAINKFLHTIFSAYTISAIFIIGVSSWFLLKKREIVFAKKSILVAGIFGLVCSIYLAATGDGSAYNVAQHQPVKLAAMEGMYNGQEGAGLIVFGVLKPGYEIGSEESPYYFKFEIPKLLSLLGYRDANAFVPGVNDLVEGNEKYQILSAGEKIIRGKVAIATLKEYKDAKEAGDSVLADSLRRNFDRNTPEGKVFLDEYFSYFGYGFLKDPEDIIPNVPMVFYAFHIMVGLGFYFILFFVIVLFLTWKNVIEKKKLVLRLAILTMPLAFIASQAGWIVAEVGRQPWVVQDYLPTVAAVTRIDTLAVQITFFLFAALFTALLITEVMIMTKQIKKGPNEGGH
jgi:cytochrome bd ubiquinol oxidase subunit I